MLGGAGRTPRSASCSTDALETILVAGLPLFLNGGLLNGASRALVSIGAGEEQGGCWAAHRVGAAGFKCLARLRGS